MELDVLNVFIIKINIVIIAIQRMIFFFWFFLKFMSGKVKQNFFQFFVILS